MFENCRIAVRGNRDRQECQSYGGEMRFRIALVAILGVLSSPQGAPAQSCALCYTTASQTSVAAQRSLDFGILTLLAPALTLFLAVIFVLYRRAAAATTA